MRMRVRPQPEEEETDDGRRRGEDVRISETFLSLERSSVVAIYRLAVAARYILGTLDGEETGEDAAERHEKGEEEWRNK